MLQAKDLGHNAQVLHIKKKVLKQKYRKFFTKFRLSPRKKIFINYPRGRAPRRKKKMVMILGHFQHVKKNNAVLGRGQGIFEDLQALRPRTSKCVFEAKDVLEDSTSDYY